MVTTADSVHNTFSSPTDVDVAFLDIEQRDNKGREIGYIIRRWTVTVEAAMADCWSKLADNYAVGTVLFASRVTPTRNGYAFGACQQDTYNDTSIAREMDIAKWLLRAFNRDAKRDP